MSKCLQCQQVKAEHQKSGGLLQPLPIPEWKWEHVTIDFVVGLPRTSRGMESIWVVVDRLTKSAHFLPVRTTFNAYRLAIKYVEEIVCLHGVPVSIVLDRDPKFVSRLWKSLQEAMGIELRFSTDRWAVRANDTDFGRYASHVCFGFSGELGRLFTTCGICL